MNGSHISLFAGVGMTDIAVEAAGYQTVAWAEIDPFCQRVLRTRFPGAAEFEDVRKVTAANQAIKRPLIVSGGFPCQDVAAPSSTQAGIQGSRTGLWTEFARIIREFVPELVLIENSNMLRTRGLSRVLADLHERGYDAAWDCIPASAVGAPHRRDRMWIVAWPTHPIPTLPDNALSALGVVDDYRHEVWCGGPVTLTRAGHMEQGWVLADPPRYTVRASAHIPTLGRMFPTITLSDGTGGPGRTPKRTGGPNLRTVMNELEGNGRINPVWGEWLMGLPLGWTNPDVPNDRLLAHPGWATEPMGVPRTVPHRDGDRAKRIKALGNGLVPQVAALALNELSPIGGSNGQVAA